VKLIIVPGASVAVVKTGVVPLKLFTTLTLVSVMLPALLTVPLNTSRPPGLAGFAGQVCATTRRGVVTSGQVAVALLDAKVESQISLPVAVTVLLTEHESAGAVKLAVKFVDTPGTRLNTVKTVLDWLLTTVTLIKVTLPEFLTVPV
jgi:hypothetical protein